MQRANRSNGPTAPLKGSTSAADLQASWGQVAPPSGEPRPIRKGKAARRYCVAWLKYARTELVLPTLSAPAIPERASRGQTPWISREPSPPPEVSREGSTEAKELADPRESDLSYIRQLNSLILTTDSTDLHGSRNNSVRKSGSNQFTCRVNHLEFGFDGIAVSIRVTERSDIGQSVVSTAVF